MTAASGVDQPTLRDQLANEFARHGSAMSRDWSDNDDEPVTVRLGCLCGHDRGEVTAAELAADLPGFVQAWRLHVADSVLPVIEAHMERAKAEAAAEALEGWARAFGIADRFGARRWRFVHAAAARALSDDVAERRAALRGSTGGGQ